MRCSARSETGLRSGNEDSVFCSPRLAAVADGVGGAVAGEVASQWAINQMIELDKKRLDGGLDDALHEAVGDANDSLRVLIEAHPELQGMASTLSAVALSDEGDYLVANVGDSRTYLLRDGELRQLTRDQSFVQELIDQGVLTPEQARRHPQRSVVLHALDGGDPDLQAPERHAARAGDRLLLCSDGVSDYLNDARIAELLGAGSTDTAAEALVGGALEAGSRDNVSAIVADIVPRVDAGDSWVATA